VSKLDEVKGSVSVVSVGARCVQKHSGVRTHDVVFLYTAKFWRLGVVSVLGFDSGLTINAGADSLKPTRGLLSDIVKYMICSVQNTQANTSDSALTFIVALYANQDMFTLECFVTHLHK